MERRGSGDQMGIDPTCVVFDGDLDVVETPGLEDRLYGGRALSSSSRSSVVIDKACARAMLHLSDEPCAVHNRNAHVGFQ